MENEIKEPATKAEKIIYRLLIIFYLIGCVKFYHDYKERHFYEGEYLYNNQTPTEWTVNDRNLTIARSVTSWAGVYCLYISSPEYRDGLSEPAAW